MRPIAFLLSIGSLLLFLVSPVSAQDESIPWPTDGWQVSSPEAQGMNSALLAAMLQTMADQDMNIHSALVIRNGYLVLEAYNYPYTANDLHTVYSVTKSFTSALFGIALDQGYIGGVDEPMLDYFPDRTIANLDDAKQSITLENLLTMSPGFDWPGGMDEPLLGDMMITDDWIGYMLDRPMRSEPGNFFTYNSAVSSLIAAIVAEATGQPLLDFAQTNLFDPLGIHSVEWATDPQGHYLGGFGLQLTPRDMAKFGYLYLNNGQWNGEQIISSDWVATSTQQHIAARPLSDGYGYQWWVDVRGYYMALGYGGQHIIVDPAHNLVIVFTSALPAQRGSLPETLFQNFILPAVQSEDALPENPEALAALQLAAETLATPAPEAVPTLPDLAAQISGQPFDFPTNDFGWDSLALEFIDGSNTAQLLLNGQPALTIGLDNVQQVNHAAVDALFAIGFDNILRANLVAGVEPMLVTGHWASDNRFAIEIALQGTVNFYQITLTFNDSNVQVTTRNGLSGSSVSFVGTAA
jgi:CubicO group peptidase (beta-lactamase class C family)